MGFLLVQLEVFFLYLVAFLIDYVIGGKTAFSQGKDEIS